MLVLLLRCTRAHGALHSFPTRRSSDLGDDDEDREEEDRELEAVGADDRRRAGGDLAPGLDRKSTRLNSSHLGSSYAVFCLKKKKFAVHPRPSAVLARRLAVYFPPHKRT